MTYRSLRCALFGITHHLHVLMFGVFLSATAIVSLLSYVAPVSAASAIHCVASTGGTTTAPCVNSTAYTTIQDAVTAASNSDEIRIASGTYTATDQYVVSIIGKSLTLRGGYSPANWQNPILPGTTIIDGQTVRPGVFVFGDSTVTLERLTITHGHNGNGGGIEANLFGGLTLTLIDMVISNNTAAGSGGGLFITGGPTSITRSQIMNNTAGEDGGGFYGLRLIAIDSSVDGNTAARHAGGINVLDASIDNTHIADNTATNGDGGGIHFDQSLIGGTLAMTRTRMLDNSAGGRGGALYLGSMTGAQLAWSLLDNNQASDGDAFVVDPSSQAPSHISLTNVTVVRTSISSHAAIKLGVLSPAAPMSLTLTNTVVTSHTIGIVRQNSASLSGDYNAFFNNSTNQVVDGSSLALPFTHLLTTDPQFDEPEANNFHFRDTSPLRDAGDPSLSYANQRDLDGIQVPVGLRADIGAYEYILLSHQIHLPLCMR